MICNVLSKKLMPNSYYGLEEESETNMNTNDFFLLTITVVIANT